ncbi:hypothetical protein [Legionella maceachernii]|uniref:Uncharacterized protein n=1 Tax=Legionella maceachernii TaxID=466 RepID=A0A0W0VVC2_9GAMM|nr:hypothetical protein [Legionella maceachernii]KTD23921.1 hypothetical protein Lmac_2794 [Legionella maceachernii]SKA17935.1 hypothetical protein SAMN02745128_02420 [Legionella maceachernii]SUP04535.1 Uncharacterised protein [Legionella maceachernii]
MFIKFLRFFIVTFIPIVLLVWLIVLLSQYINLNEPFKQLEHFLKSQTVFWLLFRANIYAVLYYLWPYTVQWRITAVNEIPTPEQIKKILLARNYLLVAVVLHELLNFWK